MAPSSDAVGPCNPSQSFFITQAMERLILSHIALTPLPALVFRWSDLSLWLSWWKGVWTDIKSKSFTFLCQLISNSKRNCYYSGTVQCILLKLWISTNQLQRQMFRKDISPNTDSISPCSHIWIKTFKVREKLSCSIEKNPSSSTMLIVNSSFSAHTLHTVHTVYGTRCRSAARLCLCDLDPPVVVFFPVCQYPLYEPCGFRQARPVAQEWYSWGW